jgi:hypothetical protein
VATVHVGKVGRDLGYRLYPDRDSFIDPGNLLQLGFFLKFVLAMVGKERSASGWAVAPRLPDTIQGLSIDGLRLGEATVSLVYHTDMPSAHGVTRMKLISPERAAAALTVGLSCEPKVLRVTVDGIQSDDYECRQMGEMRSVHLSVSLDSEVLVYW